jgi:antitoxin component YwqK of YwqJK toxin-antitoxin module
MDELLATTLSDGSAINPIYLIILYNNGLKYKEGLWSALTYTMPYTEYYRNGKIKIVGQFREDGKPMGKWIFYRKNGEIEKEETYNL